MKKFLLSLVLCSLVSISFATKIVIKVTDFQFKPSSVNAKVGDTIVFKWVNGIHNTNSLNIPAGAKSWTKPMDSEHKKYNYVLKVAGTYKYNCTFHAPGMKGTISVTAALPAGFNGFAVNDASGKAMLTWSTKSSKDLSIFSIQKSTDGENFAEVAKVNAADLVNYKFADNSIPATKFIYYQVKVIDKQGNSELSEIKMYTSNAAQRKLITSISPNPVTSAGHLMLQFDANTEGVMLVQLFNVKGMLVKQVDMSATKGLNNGHMHLGDLTPGTYYLNCTLGNLHEKHIIIYK